MLNLWKEVLRICVSFQESRDSTKERFMTYFHDNGEDFKEGTDTQFLKHQILIQISYLVNLIPCN